MRANLLCGLLMAALFAPPVLAQDTQIRFGQSLRLQGSAIEVTADTLSVDQANGSTEFSGNVLAIQDALRITAGALTLEYTDGATDGSRRIGRILASGDVLIVTPDEAIEGQNAIYSLTAQTLEMTGAELFVQRANMLSGEHFTADLNTGAGLKSGRVRTVIRLE